MILSLDGGINHRSTVASDFLVSKSAVVFGDFSSFLFVFAKDYCY